MVSRREALRQLLSFVAGSPLYAEWMIAAQQEGTLYPPTYSEEVMGPMSLQEIEEVARKKIHKLAQFLKIENVVECMKERDVKTGALLSFKTTVTDLSGQTCFIVDDICDGGGTFAGTAKMLKEKGAVKVVLIVSHGIFSKGSIIDSVDEIYTTDSFKQVAGVNCFSIAPYL